MQLLKFYKFINLVVHCIRMSFSIIFVLIKLHAGKVNRKVRRRVPKYAIPAKLGRNNWSEISVRLLLINCLLIEFRIKSNCSEISEKFLLQKINNFPFWQTRSDENKKKNVSLCVDVIYINFCHAAIFKLHSKRCDRLTKIERKCIWFDSFSIKKKRKNRRNGWFK